MSTFARPLGANDGSSYLGSCVPRREIGRFVVLYRQGKLPVDRLQTVRLSQDQVNPGFDRLAWGEAIRQAIMMEG